MKTVEGMGVSVPWSLGFDPELFELELKLPKSATNQII